MIIGGLVCGLLSLSDYFIISEVSHKALFGVGAFS